MYDILLRTFALDTGISQKQVAEKMQYSNQRVNNYFRGIAEPPFEFLEKFRTEFSVDLRKLKDSASKGIKAGVASFNPIPVFDFELKPAKTLDFFNHSELVSYYIDAPLFNDCSAAMKVLGVTMQPVFNPADIVVIKRVENFETAPLGEAYFIITEEQRLLRYIRVNKANPNKTFLLRAINTDYDDMIIKKTDIKYLFQIKGKIQRY